MDLHVQRLTLSQVWCENPELCISHWLCRIGKTDFKLNRGEMPLEMILMGYIPKAGLSVLL